MRRKQRSLLIIAAALAFFLFVQLTKREELRPPPVLPPAPQALQIPEQSETAPQDFEAAKKQMRRLFSRGQDAYCACSYDLERKPQISPQSCGLKSRAARAKRIEWEHVVPASVFGRAFPEWRNPQEACKERGRSCARKLSRDFRRMEADMYNLLPAVGELNRLRENFEFAIIPGEVRDFGACDFEVFAEKVEPRPEIRGDVARIYFYMDARYPGFHIVHKGNRELFEQWDIEDPMDEQERSRIRKIEEVQGNSFYIGRLASKTEKTRL